MKLPPVVSHVNDYLSGWADSTITFLLLLIAAALVAVAIFAQPIVKTAVLAWAVLP